MALPIAPTPILSGKYAEEFNRKIEYGLKNPVYPVPTPKLDHAKRFVKEYADKIKEMQKSIDDKCFLDDISEIAEDFKAVDYQDMTL